MHGGSQRGQQPVSVSPLQAARTSSGAASPPSRGVQAEHSSPTMFRNPVHAERSQPWLHDGSTPSAPGHGTSALGHGASVISNDAFSPEASKGSLSGVAGPDASSSDREAFHHEGHARGGVTGPDASGSDRAALHHEEHASGGVTPRKHPSHADAGHISTQAHARSPQANAHSPSPNPPSKLSTPRAAAARLPAAEPAGSRAAIPNIYPQNGTPSPVGRVLSPDATSVPAHHPSASGPAAEETMPALASRAGSAAPAASSRYRRAAKPDIGLHPLPDAPSSSSTASSSAPSSSKHG